MYPKLLVLLCSLREPPLEFHTNSARFKLTVGNSHKAVRKARFKIHMHASTSKATHEFRRAEKREEVIKGT